MPITPFHSKSDPLASLALTTSSVILALEKLRQRIVLDDEDVDAVKRISEKFESLSKATELKEGLDEHIRFETVSASVQSDFFTLVAIESSSTTPTVLPDFDQLANNLGVILNAYSETYSSQVDVEHIESTQLECLDFLEKLNQTRPAFPQQ